eukprot:1138199-Pelagomonas_calceolata.AAC.3
MGDVRQVEGGARGLGAEHGVHKCSTGSKGVFTAYVGFLSDVGRVSSAYILFLPSFFLTQIMA